MKESKEVIEVNVCPHCNNPVRNPEAEDIGVKFFPRGDTQ